MDTPKKSDRVAAFVESLGMSGEGSWDPRYLGYFDCFNRGDYYEAHDVLEDLWLKTQGPDREFYKALIQVAGAFVHLRKQYEHPDHPHHGKRLVPARRIFHSAMARLAPFAPRHLGLEVTAVLGLCETSVRSIESGDHGINPWSPGHLPQLMLNSSRSLSESSMPV